MQTHTANYLIEVFTLITRSEGSRNDPYFDSVNKVTIGYGINLEVSDYLRIVLQTIGLFDGKTNTEIAAIQQTFTNAINSTPDGNNSVLLSKLNAAAQQYGLTSFTINEAQATAAFYVILLGATIGGQVIAGKQARLDAILGNTATHTTLSHDSKEYVAVMSMFYNVESLVTKGSKLATAIIDGNRAEAWYEIRYGSNRDGGHASRRYSEAAEFGLYDNATAPGSVESRSVYRMFTAHRDDSLFYENQYPPTGTSNTIKAQLGYAFSTILGEIAGNSNADIAKAYAAWAAKGYDLNPTKLFLGDPGRGTTVDATQYTFPATPGLGVEIDSNDIVLAGDSGTFGLEGYMLVGGMGNDLLIGGAGRDYLYGGAGDDIMAGGDGDDIYRLGGGGHDTIEDKVGTNKVILNGKVLFSFVSSDGINYLSEDGAFTGIRNNGDFIVTDKSDTNIQVTLNQDFQSGDFGIILKDAPTDQAPTTNVVLPYYQVINDPNHQVTSEYYYQGTTDNDLITIVGEVGIVMAMQGGNDTINGSSGADILSAGDGNNLITGGGQALVASDWNAHEILLAGNGNNRIYANTQVDLATALANQKTAAATGQQGAFIGVGDGDNLIVGGNDNDVVFVGTGDNTVVLGNGTNIFVGGIADGAFKGDCLLSGDFTVTDIVTNDQVTLNQNFQSGDFGPGWGAGSASNDFEWKMQA